MEAEPREEGEEGERRCRCGAGPPREFRVRVDASSLVRGPRRRLLVWVRAAESVRRLRRRLRRYLPLPRAFALLSAGHLLPRAEPLAVLAADAEPAVSVVAADDAASESDSSDEVDGGPAAPLAPASVERRALEPPVRCAASGPPDEEPGELGSVKRRALELLERCAAAGPPDEEPEELGSVERHALERCAAPGPDEDAGPRGERGRRRRLRVRRRRPQPQPSPCRPEAAQRGAPGRAEAVASAGLEREAGAGARSAPRVVRAL